MSHPQVARPAPSSRFRPDLETPPPSGASGAGPAGPAGSGLGRTTRPGEARGRPGSWRAPLSEILWGFRDRASGERPTGAHNVRADHLQPDDSDNCPGMVSRRLVLHAEQPELFVYVCDTLTPAQPCRCAARGRLHGLHKRAAKAHLRLITCMDSESFKFGAWVPEPGPCEVFHWCAVLREAILRT